jgi:hypothetical protein
MNMLAHQFIENLQGLSIVEKSTCFVLAGHASYNPSNPQNAVVFISMPHLAASVGIKNRETASRIVKRMVKEYGILEPVGFATYHNPGEPPRKIAKYRFTFKVLPDCGVTMVDKTVRVTSKAPKVTGASRDSNRAPVTQLSHTESPLPVTLEVTGDPSSRDFIESHNGLSIGAPTVVGGSVKDDGAKTAGSAASPGVFAETTSNGGATQWAEATATTNHRTVVDADHIAFGDDSPTGAQDLQRGSTFSSSSAERIVTVPDEPSGRFRSVASADEAKISPRREENVNTNTVPSAQRTNLLNDADAGGVVALFVQRFEEVRAAASGESGEWHAWLQSNGFLRPNYPTFPENAVLRSNDEQRRELFALCRNEGLASVLERWTEFLVIADHWVDSNEDTPHSWLLRDFLNEYESVAALRTRTPVAAD